jgi:FixJ family two-component response regulator
VRAKVIVIDDDAVAAAYVAGVAESSGYDTVRFSSAEAFLTAVDGSARGCIVLDLEMDGMHGLELQATLVERGICLPVIIVSGHSDVATAVRAMKQKAFDFFEKPVDPVKLLLAIDRATALDTSLSVQRQDTAAVLGRFGTLSPREKQVMRLVAEGLANKQMAARLGLSEKTIEVHRGNVMRKMQVESVAALVRASLHCEADPTDEAVPH